MSQIVVKITDTEAAIRLLFANNLTMLVMGQAKERANASGRKGHGRLFWDRLFNSIYRGA